MIKRRGLLAVALLYGAAVAGAFGGEPAANPGKTNSPLPSISREIYAKLQQREPWRDLCKTAAKRAMER